MYQEDAATASQQVCNALDRLLATPPTSEQGRHAPPVEKEVAELVAENRKLREVGCKLAEAAIRVAREYDGVHRLMLAASEWAKAVADEGGRGKPRTTRATQPAPPAEGEVKDQEILEEASNWLSYLHAHMGDHERWQGTSIDLINFARAVLARWGRPAAPPAEGEVAELVEWLRETAASLQAGNIQTPRLLRAADLLSRQAPPAEALAARPLLEQVARMGDCIGANTVGQIMAISDRAAAWLRDNLPGQPVAIEPRGCPMPGACACVEPEPPKPSLSSDEILRVFGETCQVSLAIGEDPIYHEFCDNAFLGKRLIAQIRITASEQSLKAAVERLCDGRR